MLSKEEARATAADRQLYDALIEGEARKESDGNRDKIIKHQNRLVTDKHAAIKNNECSCSTYIVDLTRFDIHVGQDNAREGEERVK